jgi:YbbR domain-containing protein
MATRDYILNNFWWKLLSLLMAALTWLTIRTAFQKDEARRESPVITTSASTRTFAAVPITLMMPVSATNRFRVTPPTVSVEVSGISNELAALQIPDIKAFVDVTEAGDQKQFRRSIQARVPGDMKVTGLNPTNASVDRITISK